MPSDCRPKQVSSSQAALKGWITASLVRKQASMSLLSLLSSSLPFLQSRGQALCTLTRPTVENQAFPLPRDGKRKESEKTRHCACTNLGDDTSEVFCHQGGTSIQFQLLYSPSFSPTHLHPHEWGQRRRKRERGVDEIQMNSVQQQPEAASSALGHGRATRRCPAGGGDPPPLLWPLW